MKSPLDSTTKSIKQRLGDDPNQVIETITQRYIGQNPKIPFQLRAFNREGILQNESGQYNMDFSSLFASANVGDYLYVWGKIWSDGSRSIDIQVSNFGITDIYVNNKLIVVREDTFILELTPGNNQVIIRCEKTDEGFGCLFGSKEAMVRLLNVLHPLRHGEAGWCFSSPLSGPEGASPEKDILTHVKNLNVNWYPNQDWEDDKINSPVFSRLFGTCPEHYAYGWTQLKCSSCDIQLSLQSEPVGIKLYLNEMPLVFTLLDGHWISNINLDQGVYDLVIESQCVEGNDWGFELTTYSQNGQSEFIIPLNIKGAKTPWLFIGPLVHKVSSIAQLLTPNNIVENRYWQLDLKDTWVRPYYENSMLGNKWTTSPSTNYARWDYPLGVTLRGVYHAGKQLQRKDYMNYVKSHIEEACSMYHYSLWDSVQYGYPSLNHQLIMMKMLDHCGSFGSTLLEVMSDFKISNGEDIVEKISDFMSNDMERTKENAFFRRCKGEYLENTMWADDLYMCGPFLIHYYLKTGDEKYLDDIIHQFLVFKDYLYMDDECLLSHVYDFKCDKPTKVPWGRGNGWVFFSLSLLLEVLSPEHKYYEKLKDYFLELAYSYVKYQDDKGLWHQVLNVPDAYLETSCTAMFLYGLCKGITNHIIDEDIVIEQSIQKAWQGLVRLSIDEQGNIHGVCPGSKYAFTPDYYKNELLPVANDNHGIGIVLLSAIEYAKYSTKTH